MAETRLIDQSQLRVELLKKLIITDSKQCACITCSPTLKVAVLAGILATLRRLAPIALEHLGLLA